MMGRAKAVPVRHRLGAEEVIELGRGETSPKPNRRPFLAGRVSLDGAGSAARYLESRLEAAEGVIARLVEVEPRGLAGVVAKAPGMKEVLAQALVLGSERLGRVQDPDQAVRMDGILRTLGGFVNEDRVAGLLEEAAVRIAEGSPETVKGDVARKLGVRG